MKKTTRSPATARCKFALCLLPFVFCLLPAFSFAQNNVGIGTTTPNQSAKLDITSTNKGLLIPRVQLQSNVDQLTIPSAANGLMVMNINPTMTNGGLGIYYWDNVTVKWIQAFGVPGSTGVTGAGFNGTTGNTGDVGATGVTGAGYTGATGSVGFTGSIGPIGITGATGFIGATGDRYSTTSCTTSMTIPMAPNAIQNLVVDPGLAYTPGQQVVISVNFSLQYTATVTLYDPATGNMTVQYVSSTGSATFTACWTVNLVGLVGTQGPTGATNGWLLSGNVGTIPSQDFIGTADATNLVFRTNNAQNFQINNTTGQFLAKAAGPLLNSQPTYSFDASTSTGIYNSLAASGQLSFAVNGTERLRVTGTATPQILSQNYGTTNAPSWSWIQEPTTGIFRPQSNQIAIATNGLQQLTIGSGTIQMNQFIVDGFLRTTGNNGTLVNGGQVNLSSEVTNVLPITNGGTNSSTAGAQGGVLYYNGTKYTPTLLGIAGQVLASNGINPPSWANTNTFLPNVQNGLNILNSGGTNVELGGTLIRTTTIDQQLQTLSFFNGPISINNNSAAAPTTIGTGTTTGNITIGSGTSGQNISILSGAAVGNKVTINDAASASVTNIGTGNTTGNINIGGGSSGPGQTITLASGAGGALNLNDNLTNQTTNIGTGNTVGTLNIGGGGATNQIINVGSNPSGPKTVNIGSGNGTTVIHLAGMGALSMLLTNGTQDMISVASLGIANGGTNGFALPTAGGVAYGSGTAYAFTPAGLIGQVLISNAGGPPTWTNASTIMPAVGNGLNIGSGPTQVELGGTLTRAITTVNVNNNTLAIGGGTVNINDATNLASVTNIGTGNTSGLINIGGGTNNQVVNIKSGGGGNAVNMNDAAGTAVTNIGTGNTSGLINIGGGTNNQVVNIKSGGGGNAVNMNDAAGTAVTNIGTGTTTGIVTIGGSATQSIGIGNNAGGIKTITIGNAVGGSAINLPGMGASSVLLTDIAKNITSSTQLPITYGGTNATTIGAAGSMIYSNGTQYASTAAGTSGQVLTSGGGGAPTWTNTNALVKWNDIVDPTSPLTMNHGTFPTNFTFGNTGATPAFTINSNNVTNGAGLKVASTGALTTGSLLNVTSTAINPSGSSLASIVGNSTVSGNLLNVSSTGLQDGTGLAITTDALTAGTGLSITSNTSGLTGSLASITLSGSSSSTSGSLLYLNSSNSGSRTKALSLNMASIGNLGNNAIAGTGGVNFTFAAHTGTSSGFQIDDATVSGNAMTINANNLTTGAGIAITSNTTSTYTGNMESITLADNGSANTGNLLYLNSLGTLSKAKALSVNVASAADLGTIAGSGGVNFTLGVHSGNGVQIDDGTQTGAALKIGGNTLTTGKLLDISTGFANTWTGTGGNGLVNIASSSTAGSGSILLNLARTGANANINTALVSSIAGIAGTGTNIAADLKSSGAATNIALRLQGSTSGNLDISPAATTTSYALTLPGSVAGATGAVLTSTNLGVTSWTSVLPIANGGTGSSTQNWVDLTTVQTAAGAKTWSDLATFNLGITSTGAAVNLNASSNFATNINTGTSTGAVSIASGSTGGNTITVGNNNGATALNEIVGTGNYTLDGAGASTYTIGSSASGGTITLGGVSQTGSITIGQSTASNSINIGNASTATGNTQTINIGAGTGAGTGKTLVTIGETNDASASTINAGTGGVKMNTAAATNITHTLGTTGSTVFASSTANSDKIAILPQSTTTSAPFTGTLTSSDLTAARTWTLPDASGTLVTGVNNVATAAQIITLAATPGTYIANSSIAIPASGLRVGTVFRFRLAISKTAAGSGAKNFNFVLGTAGTTADPVILAFTIPSATAFVDVGQVDITITIRGPLGGACVAQGILSMTHNTGAQGLVQLWGSAVVNVTSGAFNSTTANLIGGLTVSNLTGETITFQQVIAEAINL